MTIPNAAHTPELALRRFLYLSTDSNCFITGDPQRHKRLVRHKLRELEELLKTDPAKVIRIVSAINGENQVPRREVIFFVLAAALTLTSNEFSISDVYRRELYTTVLYACRNDEEFFCFIKHMTTMKKTFPSGLNKVISRYYKNKEPMDLVRDACKRKGYHNWTHKDLIKLSHIKTDNTLLQIAITYILKGLPAAEAIANEKKEGKDIIKYIKRIKRSRKRLLLKKQLNMSGQQVPFELIPPQFNHNVQCLETLLKYIGVKELLPLLLRFYKLKMLKIDSEAHNRVVKILSDSSKVKASGVHPYEVYLALRYFEKGGKAKDPKLIAHLEMKEKAEKAEKNITEFTPTNWARVDPTNSPLVVDALKKCLQLSYANVVPCNRRFLITVEVSENMSKPCLTSKWLSGYEAAAIEVMTYVKTEKNVVVAVFNGDTITEVTIDKGNSIEQTIKCLQDANHGELQMGASIEYARSKKKSFDVFINIVHTPLHKHFITENNLLINPLEAYVKYKSAMNMSSTKLVLHNLNNPVQTVFPESSLDIRGFDEYVPRVIDAYVKNLV
ncbi:LOW QUALITY PROTEIN: RNA-binding protein RO60 [Atheta coriaria]|uniref:LOW QUALITY PROTEIN: RNA-binding protein RO60 n=1 Tax=Dalotia coriaria TaxID=877792 RepID=UPI0031F35A4C